MIFYIYQACKNIRLSIILILLLILIESLVASFSLSALIPLVEIILGRESSLSWVSKFVPAIIRERMDWMFYGFGALMIVKAALTFLRIYITIKLSEGMRKEWQVRMTEKIIFQPYEIISSQRKGDLISDLTRQTDYGAVFLLNYLVYFSNIVILSFVLATLIIISWQAVAIFTVIGSLLWFTVGRKYYSWSTQLGKRGVLLNQQLMSEMTESLTGIKDIKIFSAENFRIKNIGRIADQARINRSKAKIAQQFPNIFSEGSIALCIIFLGIFIGTDKESLQNLLPTIVFIGASGARIISLASSISVQRFKVVNKFPSFKIVIEKLETEPMIQENHGGEPFIGKLTSDIEFKNIDFQYPNNDRNTGLLLSNFNLSFTHGEITCLFGPSGSGKSTTLDLLARLYDPVAGEITANGKSISQYDLKQWRQKIGYVGQEPTLFYGSIYDNIIMGIEDFDPAKLEEACEIACVKEFTNSLKDGLNTMLEDMGGGLSGGQKMRIAIARALVRDVSVLVLDETTNALKEDMEQQLIHNLRKNKDLTIILISHRKSTARLADHCYEFHAGKVQRIN